MGETFKNELENSYSVVGWLSNSSQSTENIWEFLFGLVPPDKINGDAVKDYEAFYNQYFMKFLFMVLRRGLYWKDVHEIRNEFSILYYNIYNILVGKEVDIIIFPNLPHEGADYIFYNIAKRLEIKTIIFHQAIFPNKIFVTTSLEDFGNFKNIPSLFTNDIVIEEGFNQKIFYMKQFEDKLANKKKNTIKKISKKVLEQFQYFRLKLKNLLSYKKEKNIVKNIVLKVTKRIENYSYKKILSSKSCLIKEIEVLNNSETKVVYIPLHLQPELSTVTLGEVYEDQLSMIEAISSKLGKEDAVLVKENPYQDSFQRNKNFFMRINKLHNVYLIDINYPSFELLERADIVATISGTAGWEAIKGGKRCLLFGKSWYQRLPGCFKYNNMNLNNFIEEEYQFNFNDFQNAFSSLMDTCADGIVDKDYIVEVKNFTYNRNARNLVSSLDKIISNKKVRWNN